MAKFIETIYPTIEDRVSRWETMGMLHIVKSDDSKKLVAMALDATAIYLTEFNFKNFDNDTKTVLIPVIVRIFNETNKDFTLETLTKSVRRIIEDFVEKYEEAKPKFNPLTSERDDDAEFIKFCEERQKREEQSKKNDFTKNLDDLLHLTNQKRNLTKHLTTNYKENVHYIIDTNIQHKSQTRHGGHNIVIYMLTEEAFELFKSSYNLRNRYIVELNDKIKCINNYAMCIENQTIGFIENSFKDVLNCKRQYKFDKYRVDLYFIDYKLIVECDEHGHNDRDQIKEKIREDYLISLSNKIIRYNPNDELFDLSNVLREIYKVIMTTSL